MRSDRRKLLPKMWGGFAVLDSGQESQIPHHPEGGAPMGTGEEREGGQYPGTVTSCAGTSRLGQARVSVCLCV